MKLHSLSLYRRYIRFVGKVKRFLQPFQVLTLSRHCMPSSHGKVEAIDFCQMAGYKQYKFQQYYFRVNKPEQLINPSNSVLKKIADHFYLMGFEVKVITVLHGAREMHYPLAAYCQAD